MKTVIEKIILNYFGKFINGIHKDNLSVSLFQGNFQLESISLNQKFFDELNTPFTLTYSSIGKLNLQAQLSKLSSAPVECTLDNIYAVFQFKNENKNHQQPSPQKLLLEKKQFIEKYVRDMFQEYLKKLRQKDEKKEDGMMARLGKKIIDNLQLKIINVHIRFQQIREDHKYAWGVTLEQISFMTTDNQWKPSFVDRSAQQNKLDKLFKKMSLKNFSVYWQSGTKCINEPFISQIREIPQRAKSMAKMIKDPKYSILSLTSEVKLIMNNPQNYEAPLYQLSVDLAPIVFELQKVQVSQMIDFTKKNISENQQILKRLSLKKQKSKKEIGAQEKKKFQLTFQQYVQQVVNIYEASKQKGKKADEEFQQLQNITILKNISNKIEDEELLVWALKPIRLKVKQARERQLKKKKKGWFGGQYQLNEQQTKALQNFVQEVIEVSQKQRPADCLFFSLNVMIQGGKFSFIQNKNLPEQEKLQFEIGNIRIFLLKSQNDSILDLTVGVQKISLNLFLPVYGTDQRMKINIIKNLEFEELQQQFFDPGEEEQKFISIKFCKKVQSGQKPVIKTDIIGQVKQVVVTYKKIFMKKFKSFFTFKNFNQSLRNQTKKKWQQMKQKNQQKNISAQEQNQVLKMFYVEFKIISPLFVCPLNQKEGWCLNLGQLSIQSNRDNEKQVYPIHIQSAYFRYYPDLRHCLKKLQQKQLKKLGVFSLVNDINFSITHVTYLFQKKELTHISLPNFEVNFNDKQKQNLLSMKDIFKADEAQNNLVQFLKKERLQIEKHKIYEGAIQKKGLDLGKWKTFYAILSGEFIYFYGSEKELKCIQKIQIKNLRLEYNAENQIIQLIHHQQGILQLTGGEFEHNSLDWKNKIQSQMKSFMTIYEIVDEMIEKDQQIEPNRKRKDTSQSAILSRKQKIISFNIEKIGFNYRDEHDKQLMVFKLFGLKFQQKQQNKIIRKQINIQTLEATDHIHTYADKSLQILIATKGIVVQIDRNKNDEQKKYDILVNISDIYINWKPDVLIIFLKLIYSYLLKQAKLRVDDGQQKTRNQLFQQVLNDPKFSFSMKQYERNSQGREVKEKRLNFVQKNKRLKQLIKLNFIIKKTQVLMIHRQTHLVMFKLIADKIQNELTMGENEKFVSGNIKSLQLYEMTGYPQNNYNENDVAEPYLIIKPRFPNSEASLVQYKWSSYEAFVLPNMQRVNSFMHVVLNPIEAQYFQQITFRLIDYLLIQIILLLNQPQMLVANQNLLQQLKKKTFVTEKQAKQKSQTIVKILFSEYEQVVRKIIDPYFMDMYFQLKQPSILMKPQKKSKFYHRADFKNIIFVNQDKKNTKRFQKCECPQVMKYIYEQLYQVMCNQCNFFSVQEGQKQQLLFEPVDINLTINKLIMEDEINLIYPELNTYDRSFQTTNKISKLVIKKLTRQQYLFINKLVNFNIVFDDNKDQCFIHNFKITKLLSPKPIYYELLIPNIQLTGKQGTLNSKYDLFTMTMGGFKLIYQRNADLNSFFRIQLMKANLFGYQYPLQQLQSQKNLLILQQQIVPKRIQLMDFKPKIKNQSCTDITIKMKTSGQKIIQMNIQNIQAYLRLHLVQLIFQWCLMQDSVFPTVSVYANDITFHLTIHKMSAWLKQMLENVHKNPRAFRLVGVFCYKFHRKAGFSQQHLQDQLRNKIFEVSDIDNMPQTSYMTILLNTQIYHCLASGNTQTKRQVVQKMTFNMTQKKYNKVANQHLAKIKTMTHRKLNLDKGLFKFSFTDIFLMRDILGQIFKERQYIGQLRAVTTPKKMIEQPTQQITETQISNLQNLDVDVDSISFYLINNCREAFIPILRLHLNNATISKCSTSRKDILKASFDTSAFYFNASIFKWEPMLQKVDLNISKLVYISDEENVFFSIETTKPLLINISKQMVAALRDTLNEWNKKQQSNNDSKFMIEHNQKQDLHGSPNKKQRSLNENIELVSQYVIRNQIGYPIQIYNHSQKKLMYKIHHLQQIDYQYELEKYDEESQIQILIGIDIIHSKYKFKRITHIPLGGNINFTIKPQIAGKNKQQSMSLLPMNSIIKFVTETKDSKRYLILKTTKLIQYYLNNKLDITLLPFDHKQTIQLREQPLEGKQVSLYKTAYFDKNKDKYRFIGQNGVLKIMGKALVYNYTPIPLQVCGFYLLPDQFVTIYNQLTIQNVYYKQCKGVKTQYDEKTKTFNLYCEGYIIDYAGLYFDLEESKAFSHQFIKHGLKFTIYLLSDTESKIKVKLSKKFKSSGNLKCSALIKPAVGNQIFQLQDNRNSLCQYQTYGYLSSITGNEYKSFKKIIQIAPRYILSNTTNYKIKVCQIESCQSVTLQPGERLPFFWQNKSKPKQIKIAALKEQSMWGYSGPLIVTHNTHSFVVRNTSKISDYRILSLQVQNTNTINFIHIIDCHPKKGNNIMLCNKVQGITLRFYQSGIFEKDYEMLNPHQYLFIVKTGEELPFGYQIPLQKHQIHMDLVFDPKNEKFSGAKFTSIVLQDIQNNLFQKKIDIITKQNKKKCLLLKLSFEGNVKKLQLMQFQKGKPQIKQGQFLCKIPNILISLIGYQEKVRKQIVHIIMNKVELETAKTNKVTQYVFKIRQFQIQNCLQMRPIFPVIMQSNLANSQQFFIQFMIVKDNFNSKLIHYIGVSINKFILAITSQQIQALQQNRAEITQTLSLQPISSGIQSMREYELFQKPNQQLNSNLYFIQAEIHPLKFNATFKHVNNWGGRLLKTFASIDNCNLSVAGKKISHFSSRNISEFFNHLQKHYQEGISKVILPMIGNLAILGSPLSLAQRIGSGFKDLIELPSEGFNVSTLEGGKGLAKGAGSLVKNTFEGAFNSVQSMTGSVGNGISSLAFDQQFSKERQKIQSDKSQHIGQGLTNGAKSIFNGFAKGITGLVTSPVEGAQESGIGGFFVGGLKGITGLVVKPVSGIFDATTKTFEGIKNTPSYFQHMGQQGERMKRKRHPRVFYGYNREFRSYDEDLSICSKYIAEKDEERFQNLSWYGVYHLVSQQKSKKNPLLLVTHEYLIILNLTDNAVLQKYKSQDIYDALSEGNNKVNMMILDSKKKAVGHIQFHLKQPNAIKLRNDLKIISNCYRPVYGFDYQLIDNKNELIQKTRQSDRK